MVELGVSFSQEAVKCKRRYPKLIKTIEVGSLLNLMSFSGDFTFHFRKENPFDYSSPSVHLLKPEHLKSALEWPSTGVDRPSLRSLLMLRPPKIVSFHLGHSVKNVRKVPPDDHDEAVGEIPSREEVFATFCQSLEIIQNSFLVQELHLPIAVENLDYHSGGAYEYICEPDFIKAIFARFPDLYLLLDIAHSEISALALLGGPPRFQRGEVRPTMLGGDPQNRLAITREYLKFLPPERLIQVHINAPHFENSQSYDMHLPIGEIEIALVKDLLELPNLRIVNLECTKEVRRQVEMLSKILG